MSNHDLSKYRIDQADECLGSARKNLVMEEYKTAANRSYYCVFNAMKSILALDEIDFKKHSAVISYFRQTYIKTGVFEVKLSDFLEELFRVRGASDYDDFFIVSKKDVEQQIEKAEYFLNEIKEHLKMRSK